MSHDPSPSESANTESTQESNVLESPLVEVEAAAVADQVGESATIEQFIEPIDSNVPANEPTAAEMGVVELVDDLSVTVELTADDLTTAAFQGDDLPEITSEPAGMPDIPTVEVEIEPDPDPSQSPKFPSADSDEMQAEIEPAVEASGAADNASPLPEPPPPLPPRSPEPRSTTSRPAAPRSPRAQRSSTAQDETIPQTIARLFQEQALPVIKKQVAHGLRLAIRGLEYLITQLEAPPQPAQPTSRSTPLGQTSSRQKTSGSQPEVVIPRRNRGALTAAIVGIGIVAIVLLPGFLSKGPEPVSDVAVIPAPSPISEIPDEVIITPDVPQPEPSPVAPAPEVSKRIESPGSEDVGDSGPSQPEVPIALEPIPEPSPEPSPEPIPEPLSEPAIPLTPQQKLLATIKDDLNSLSNSYSQSLIQAIKVNFRLSRLTVVVSPAWYNLEPKQQSMLANELLERSQQLDFSRLEITDAQEVLLARNPLVGIEMIILRRTPPAIAT